MNFIDRKRLFWTFFVVIIAVSGCEDETTELELTEVVLPEGGTVCSMVGGKKQLASSSGKLFRRSSSEADWERFNPELRTQSFDYHGCLELVRTNDYLWGALQHYSDDKPALFRSRDGGVTWEKLRLPDAQRRGNTLSLIKRKKDLFVAYGNRIWRFEQDAKTGRWDKLTMDGTVLTEKSAATLNPTIQAYFPGGDSTETELLAIYSDQLLIYRRKETRDDWILVSVLPESARFFRSFESSVRVFISAGGTLYSASPPYENWKALYSANQSGSDVTAVRLRANKNSGHLLVGRSDGAILKNNAETKEWRVVQESDSDHRSILGFRAEAGATYALTEGQGLLLTRNGLTDWQCDNQGLTGTTILSDIEHSGGDLRVGTDAGVFELTGDVSELGAWKKVSPRAVTAIEKIGDHLVAGTREGSLLSLTDETRDYPLANAFKVSSPLFSSSSGSDNAITGIQKIPEKKSYAMVMSLEHGMFRMHLDTGDIEPINWPEGFDDVVRGDVLKNWRVTQEGKLFLATQPVSGRGPIRVWEFSLDSAKQGVVESKILDAKKGGLPVRLSTFKEGGKQHVLFSYARELSVLDEIQNTWRRLPNNWVRGPISGHSFHQGVNAFFVQSDLQDWFVVSTGNLRDAERASYRVQWPRPALRGPLDQMILRDNTLYLKSQRNLFVGYVPEISKRVSNGVTIILTITGVFLVTAIGFVLLKFS